MEMPSLSASTSSNLFTPLKIGTMSLSHRIVLAPLTRLRTNAAQAPLKVVKEYYSQRASTPGTLLITEGTIIDPSAAGLPKAPGIWSKEQIDTWKEVVDAVHAKGSYIFLQLAAMGRVAQPAVLQAMDPKLEVVGAGNIPLPVEAGGTGIVPRPMTVEEIHESTALFGHAASDAVNKVGFDGVEIHGANGYLVEQFIKDTTNNREDEYGGSVEKRARFALEVVDAVARAVGEERTALRLSPWFKEKDMGMKNPLPTYAHLVSRLRESYPKLAYLHLIESREVDNVTETNQSLYDLWNPRPLIVADGFTRAKALNAAEREGLLVAFGRQFIANPDLPLRLKLDMPLNAYDRSTFYGGDESGKGYTDYPFSSESIAN